MARPSRCRGRRGEGLLTMKTLTLFLFLVLAAACQVPAGGVDVGAAVRDGIAAADRDRDGQLSKDEIRGAKNDPMFWLTFGSTILSILGLGGAAAAKRQANKVEAEVDEQWDAAAARKPLA